MTQKEKTALVWNLRFTILSMLFSLFFLYASYWYGGYTYIFALFGLFLFLAAAIDAPTLKKEVVAHWAIKAWKTLVWVNFICYSVLVVGSGYDHLFFTIAFCIPVLAFLSWLYNLVRKEA